MATQEFHRFSHYGDIGRRRRNVWTNSLHRGPEAVVPRHHLYEVLMGPDGIPSAGPKMLDRLTTHEH